MFSGTGKVSVILLTGIIILASFFFYSFRFLPYLNSDCAVVVLMAHAFDFSNDLYYWGQNRWGSLVQLLAQIWIKPFHVPALWAVSLTYYLWLVAGFAGYCRLFRSNVSKIMLALMIFLPPLRFADLLWYPTGIVFSLVGTLILFLKNPSGSGVTGRLFRNKIAPAAVVLLMIAAAWVSDAALPTLILLTCMLIYFSPEKVKTLKKLSVVIVSGLLAGFFFLSYAKSRSAPDPAGYLGLNSPGKTLESLGYIADAFLEVLMFRSPEPLMSLYLWMALPLVIFLFSRLIKKRFVPGSAAKMWIAFFLLDAVLQFTLAVLSEWVIYSGTSRRYFIGCYLSFSAAMLLILENALQEKKLNPAILFFTFLILLTGSLSTPYHLKKVDPGSLVPQVKVLGEFGGLGDVGIIGAYWFSYVTACVDPVHIKATPHDQDFVRSERMVEEVFAQPKILIVRNMWMDEFPDSLIQFGRRLKRAGDEFKIAEMYVCEYSE